MVSKTQVATSWRNSTYGAAIRFLAERPHRCSFSISQWSSRGLCVGEAKPGIQGPSVTESIVWPEGFTHLQVSGRLDGEINMHSKFIRRRDIAATVADGVDDEVQVILDGLMEPGILYSKRHRPSFSEAVVLQHTDSTSWTSQAGTVKIGVEAVKLVHAPGRQLVRSESAVVKRGADCNFFHTPGLRVVPGVSVCHSEGTPKLEEGQQAVAKVKESAIIMPRPAWHSYYESCSLASVTVKYDSKKNVNLRRINTEKGLAAGHKFAG